MPDIERKTIELADLKALDDAPNGGFAGYGSTFGNLDRVGDIVLKGAYAATLDGFLKDGFIASNHEWDEAIGYITKAHEDDHGLWIEVAFHSTPKAQEVRRIVNERLAAGKSVSLSIGYRADDYSYDQDGTRLLKAVTLYEVSVVTVPANPEATVLSGKALPEEGTDAAALEALTRYLALDAGLAGIPW